MGSYSLEIVSFFGADDLSIMLSAARRRPDVIDAAPLGEVGVAIPDRAPDRGDLAQTSC